VLDGSKLVEHPSKVFIHALNIMPSVNINLDIQNFCIPVRNGLVNAGYSSVKVLNACKSALGEMKIKKQGDDKRGAMRVNVKKDMSLNTMQPGSVTFQGSASVPMTFIAWNDAMEKAHKIAGMESVSIPDTFTEWLKFAHKDKEVLAPVEPAKA
jgi:hypothetical protein